MLEVELFNAVLASLTVTPAVGLATDVFAGGMDPPRLVGGELRVMDPPTQGFAFPLIPFIAAVVATTARSPVSPHSYRAAFLNSYHCAHHLAIRVRAQTRFSVLHYAHPFYGAPLLPTLTLASPSTHHFPPRSHLGLTSHTIHRLPNGVLTGHSWSVSPNKPLSRFEEVDPPPPSPCWHGVCSATPTVPLRLRVETRNAQRA